MFFQSVFVVWTILSNSLVKTHNLSELLFNLRHCAKILSKYYDQNN